ncbi:MFS transporter [Egicoccus halophilus]|uniref:MFS transporter n=1 Tax=Egicoccus halophilus TaxID=1670830 RepID=UPI0013EE8AE6|nr:MFS transporter [Egicoccus halophilus]
MLAPLPPRPSTRFSGWRIVVLAAIGLGMTGPGQTAGVSVFVDHLMAGLDLTRSQVSTAYLVGTLVGATTMPRIGRLLDERGSRFAMAVVGGLFGVMLAAMSGVVGLVTLTIGFAGIRMFGQGGLSLVSTTSVAPWFDRRRGFAIGVATAAGGGLLSLVPIVSAYVIEITGWRLAWLVLAVAVWAVVLPIALGGLIDRPADVGQHVDGVPTDAGDPAGRPATGPAFTRAQALRTPMFWAVSGAVATTGMIGTGLAFHQIDLLGEQGLTPVEAAANFLPQTVASIGATLLVGSMVDRFAARWVLLVSMLAMAGAMVAVPFVSPGWSAVGYGMLIGAAGSSARALEAASFPKLFGIPNLGAIRGVVASISVASTAFGPLALSLGRDLTGSYVQVLLALLVLPLGIAVFGLFAPTPRPAPDAARPAQPGPRDDLGS